MHTPEPKHTTFELHDAENSRLTFGYDIPSRSQRDALIPGELAKLVFLSSSGSEGMWVEITERGPDGTYIGRMENDAVMTPIGSSDLVRFAPAHVVDIYRSAERVASH